MKTTTIDEIDLLVLSEDEKLNLEKLQEVYKDVTYVQAMRGFYDGCKRWKKYLAGLSVILALGTPVLLAEKMPEIALIVFTVLVAVLVGIEYTKERVLVNMNKIRIVNKKKKVRIPTKRLYLAFFTLMCLDVCFGFFGSSHIVNRFLPVKGVVEISSLDTVFAKREAMDTMQLFNSKASFIAKAAEIHEKNQWLGVTVKDARQAQLDMENRAAKVQDSILAVLSVIGAEKRQAASELKAKNEAIIKEHNLFCYGLGWIVAIAATLLNFFLVVLSAWGADFDEKVLQDAKARKELLEKANQTPNGSNLEKQDGKATDSEKTAKDGKNAAETAEIIRQASQNVDNMAFAKDSVGMQIKMGTDSQTATKVCAFDGCKKGFVHNVHNQKFCSDSCRKKNHNSKNTI